MSIAGNNRRAIESVLFGIESRAGKLYDIAHLLVVAISVLLTMVSSVAALNRVFHRPFSIAEWLITFLFTADYILRLYSVRKRMKYATSFFGLVDLVSILPSYIGIFVPGTRFLSIIRFLRILRVFRVLNLSLYQSEMQALQAAIAISRRRIMVFIFFILVCVVVLGSMMYVIEGPENGFTSIPISVYWAIVTLTTVGYGDISPQTIAGKFLANLIMLLGYSIIIIPTGIVIGTRGDGQKRQPSEQPKRRQCPGCGLSRHQMDAVFCRRCGTRIVS